MTGQRSLSNKRTRNQPEPFAFCPTSRHGSDVREIRMLRCTWCGQPLEQNAAWKGRAERFYCTEFCAEVEAVDAPPLVPSVEEPTPALTRRG